MAMKFTEQTMQMMNIAKLAVETGQGMVFFNDNANALQWSSKYRALRDRAKAKGHTEIYDLLYQTSTRVPTKSSMVSVFRKEAVVKMVEVAKEVNTKATKSKHQYPESLKGTGDFAPKKTKNVINPFRKGKKDDRMNPHGMPRKQKPGVPDWEQIHNWMSDHEGWHDGPTIGKYSGVGHGYDKALKELLMASMVEANWEGKAPLYKAKVVI